MKHRSHGVGMACAALAGFAAVAGLAVRAQAQTMPATLRGTWRIAKILPTHNTACWDQTRARTLLGTTLTYGAHTLKWSGGTEPIAEALTRTLSARQFRSEAASQAGAATPALHDLGIGAGSVVEVDLQHEDADITGATTEIPGDTVLLAGPGRIVVSACGVYYSAVRVAHDAQGGR